MINYRLIFTILPMAVILSGCAGDNNNNAYKKTMQAELSKRMSQIHGADGICNEIYTSNIYKHALYKNYTCMLNGPKGYDFDIKLDNNNNNMGYGWFKKSGYANFGNPFMCKTSPTKNAMYVPVKIIQNKDVWFDKHDGNFKKGYFCSGHFEITKIKYSTKPHYNQMYAMKTSVVTAYAGLRDTAQVMSPSFAKKVRNKLFIMKALLGEESRGHWTVITMLSLKRLIH